VAVTLLASVPVVALNVPVVIPPATVTDVGTVTAVWLLVKPTAAPPAGAALVKVIVHIPAAFGPKLAGQANEDTCTGEPKLIVTLLELPLYVAVIVAF